MAAARPRSPVLNFVLAYLSLGFSIPFWLRGIRRDLNKLDRRCGLQTPWAWVLAWLYLAAVLAAAFCLLYPHWHIARQMNNMLGSHHSPPPEPLLKPENWRAYRLLSTQVLVLVVTAESLLVAWSSLRAAIDLRRLQIQRQVTRPISVTFAMIGFLVPVPGYVFPYLQAGLNRTSRAVG